MTGALFILFTPFIVSARRDIFHGTAETVIAAKAQPTASASDTAHPFSDDGWIVLFKAQRWAARLDWRLDCWS